MAGYLKIDPQSALTILSEILVSSGYTIDEVDQRKIDAILTPNNIPAANIPPANTESVPQEVQTAVTISPAETPSSTVPDDQPSQASGQSYPPNDVIASMHFNEVELDLLRQCLLIDEENMELSYLRTSLSLTLLEAEFLRMQFKLFNLKARSVLDLFQCCEYSRSVPCRCPEIRQRVHEMGILVQRIKQNES